MRINKTSKNTIYVLKLMLKNFCSKIDLIYRNIEWNPEIVTVIALKIQPISWNIFGTKLNQIAHLSQKGHISGKIYLSYFIKPQSLCKIRKKILSAGPEIKGCITLNPDWAQDYPFTPIRIYFGKKFYIIFVYIKPLIILQNLKKILRADAKI